MWKTADGNVEKAGTRRAVVLIGQMITFVHCTIRMITMTIPMRIPRTNLPTLQD